MILKLLMLLVLINLTLWIIYTFSVHPNSTPAISSMRDIVKVYEVLDSLCIKSGAHKVAISKVCVKCDEPYAEILYDNNVEGEEKYALKYNRVPITQPIVNELKIVSKGRVVAVTVADLPEGLKKELYTSEGLTYSETHKLLETEKYLYVLLVHYKIPIEDIPNNDNIVIKQHLVKLMTLFGYHVSEI